jgi:hypothetical protein
MGTIDVGNRIHVTKTLYPHKNINYEVSKYRFHINCIYIYIYIYNFCVEPEDGLIGRNMYLKIINCCVLTGFTVILIVQRAQRG